MPQYTVVYQLSDGFLDDDSFDATTSADAEAQARIDHPEISQIIDVIQEDTHVASLNGLKTADAQNDTQLRPFSKNDWYGFAGAEKFADGSEPLIAWVDFTQWPDESFQGHESGPIDGGAVIVDGNQISVSGNNAAFVKDTSGDKEADIALGNKIVAGAPINYHDLVRMGFEPINFGNDEELRNDTGEEGRVPMNASAKVAGPLDLTNSPSDYSKGAPSNQGPDDDEPAPDEETTESIISHLNAVLQDGSMTQEDRLLRAYAELGQFLENREMISGHVANFGQRHPQASDKSAARMNVERPEQAFQDNPDKYLVHVASQALEGLVGGKIKYTDHKAAEAALAKLLREGGIQPTEFTQLGYDDVSFEVADQAAAIKATDYLNSKLPKSSEAGGYGYGTAEPAQAASYRQTSDQQEGDEYSDPGGWVYPESTL